MTDTSAGASSTACLGARFETTLTRQLRLLSEQMDCANVMLYSGLEGRAWFSRKGMPDADALVPPLPELDECFRASPDGVIVVADLKTIDSPDIALHPWVAGAAGIRSAAVTRIHDRDGRLTGCLALLNQRAGVAFSEHQRRLLVEWAGVLADQINLRRSANIREATSGLFTRQYLMRKLDFPATRSGADWLVTINLLGLEVAEEITAAQGCGYVEKLCGRLVSKLRGDVLANRPVFSIGPSQIAVLYAEQPDCDFETTMKQLSDFIDQQFAVAVDFCIAPRTSIGVARIADAPAEELLRQALLAMHQAHDTGESWSTYEELSDARRQRRFSILSELPLALRSDDQLYLAFQPQVDLSTGQCHGVETLLRWRNPVLGQVSPLELIHAAETSSLMKPLTDWVLDHALSDAASWRRVGLMQKVAVNLSAYDLMDPKLLDRVRRALNRHELPGDALELEFTETSLVSEIETALPNLLALHDLGVSTAVDDFGTGYCNLSYLSRLPALTVKIDRSFIAMLDNPDPRGHRLTRGVIELVHSLDFRTIAEGIETEASGSQITQWGCNSGQGYFISKPMEADCTAEWLRSNQRVCFAA